MKSRATKADKEENSTDSQEQSATQWSKSARIKAEIVSPLVGLKPIPPDKLVLACDTASKLLGRENVSEQTIRNWLVAYEKDGLKGLERKPRNTRGKSKVDARLIDFITDQILDPHKFSLSKVWKFAKKEADRLQIKRPTYAQVKFVSDLIPEEWKTYGREGEKAYRDNHELVVRFEATYPNEMWQGDDHLLDILVKDPKTGKGVRPTMTVFIDDYSRGIPGFCLRLQRSNSTSIALALRHAMLPKDDPRYVIHGIPKMLYIDNGKNWISNHIKEACLHFKIDLNRHEAYLPRAKGKIERFFRRLEEDLISDLDGYVGSLDTGRRRPKKVKYTLEELYDKIFDWILNDYHEEKHGTTQCLPRKRWENPETPSVIQRVQDEADLDYLLKQAKRRVRKDGVHLHCREYTDIKGILGKYIGKDVSVFYDDRDLSWVKIRSRERTGDTYICTAYVRELQPHKDDRLAIAARSRKLRQAVAEEVRPRIQRGQKSREALEQADSRTVSPTPNQRKKPKSGTNTPSKPRSKHPQFWYEFEER